MAERTTEQVSRSGRRPGFHMKPKHVGLVFCVSLVGCMVAFGAGFIAGMGYKASEQVSPYVVKKLASVESSTQPNVSSAAWEEESLTFYDALIKDVPAEMAPGAATTQAPEPAPAAPSSSPVPAPDPIPVRPAPPVVAQGTDPAPQATAPSRIGASGDIPRRPVPQAAAPTNNAPTLGSAESVAASYSVQVASFLAPENAERLIEELTKKGYRAYVHPFEVPGQPSWYRVKVGKFTDRAAADVALQKLRSPQIPDAMITRD